jgi:hypothetical protein
MNVSHKPEYCRPLTMKTPRNSLIVNCGQGSREISVTGLPHRTPARTGQRSLITAGLLFLSTLPPSPKLPPTRCYGATSRRGKQRSRFSVNQSATGLLIARHWSLITVCALLISAANIFAQGSLTPPGAPTPTMKSLDQIEARAPISSAPFTIGSSGSYYLTNNLSVASGNAITINANGVTLDLNGFTISSTAGSATGTAVVLNSGLHNIAILNGCIDSGVTVSGGLYSGSGFAYGISYTGTAPVNVRVSGVSVSGILYDGISLGLNSTIIQSCVVDTAGNMGLYASSVLDSVATNCGLGVEANYANNCRGVSSGSGYGVFAFHSAINCYGNSSTGTGLFAADVAASSVGTTNTSGTGLHAATANNSLGFTYTGGNALEAYVANGCWGVSQGTGDGIHASSTAVNCYGSSASGSGINSDYIAENCRGYSSSGYAGISGYNVQNCYGYTNGSYFGVNAIIAIGCYGYAGGNNGTGLNASIANSCLGEAALSGTAETVTHKYNMP